MDSSTSGPYGKNSVTSYTSSYSALRRGILKKFSISFNIRSLENSKKVLRDEIPDDHIVADRNHAINAKKKFKHFWGLGDIQEIAAKSS